MKLDTLDKTIEKVKVPNGLTVYFQELALSGDLVVVAYLEMVSSSQKFVQNEITINFYKKD